MTRSNNEVTIIKDGKFWKLVWQTNGRDYPWWTQDNFPVAYGSMFFAKREAKRRNPEVIRFGSTKDNYETIIFDDEKEIRR